MVHHLPICYRAPNDRTEAGLPRGRGHLLLLHIDVADADLALARVWPNATAMDAYRMARHPYILYRLCPLCLSEHASGCSFPGLGRDCAPNGCP